MKKKLFTVTIIALSLAMFICASAEGGLSATLNGNLLQVNWPAGSGSATLTVYKNGWPVSIHSVNSANGSYSCNVYGTGTYTVRLRGSVCAYAQVQQGGSQAPANTPAAIATPAPMFTYVPVKPSVAPTAKPTAVPTAETNGSVAGSLADMIIREVNIERQRYGLQPVAYDAELTAAALIRGKEIVQKFSHTRPDGTSWSTVSPKAKGENIAMGYGTVDKVMAAWMSSSEGHRENILRESYTKIGVCAYEANGIMYWVQLFGR